MRRWFEVLLAVAMTAALEAELAIDGNLTVPAAAAAALVTLPLAVRFSRPLLTIVLGAIGSVLVATLIDGTSDPLFAVIAALLALYALGSRTSGWRFWLGAGIALAAGVSSTIIREGVTSDIASAVLATAIGLLLGRALGVLETETE